MNNLLLQKSGNVSKLYSNGRKNFHIVSSIFIAFSRATRKKISI